VVRADEAGVVLEWRGPHFVLREVAGDDGRPYSAIEAPGWAQTAEPGRPQLPFTSVLAVVPPSGEVTLQIQTLERSNHPLPHPVAPARAPVPVGDPPTHMEWTWARDELAYAGTGLSPTKAVTLEEVGWLRERRLVRVTFYPLRFDPVASALEATNRVRVELDFAGAVEQAATASRWDKDAPFLPVIQNAVINPAQVTRFLRTERPIPIPEPALGPDPQGHSLALPPADTEYLIITHSDFANAVAPLSAHRATVDGLEVFTAQVEDIYAAYGELAHEEAIRQYIQAAYEQAPPPNLNYVLLVGDGVRDMQNQSEKLSQSQDFIPPYMVTVSPVWCVPPCSPWDAASDYVFVAALDGHDDDPIADVSIGRLPVNTAEEASIIVDKILNYELDPPQWPWNQRTLLFAGNEGSRPDEKFHSYSDEVYHDHLRAPFTGQRVYFCISDTSSCEQPHLITDDIAAAKAATVRALNGGGLLASYVGHSSIHQWAVDPVTWDSMFHQDDVANLHNGGALPVVLEMTCYTSDFSNPEYDALDEKLVRRPGGGGVATWGCTTIGLSLGHSILHKGFFDAVFQEEKIELGQAILAAQLDLLKDPYHLDLLDTFVLLGDPAMDLNLDIVPWAHGVFLPLTLRDR
jgi:hypothetical protein